MKAVIEQVWGERFSFVLSAKVFLLFDFRTKNKNLKLPGLRHVEAAYTKNWRFAFGFASIVCLCPGGEQIVGFCSAADAKDSKTFDAFLQTAQSRSITFCKLREQMRTGQFAAAAQKFRQLLQSVTTEIAERMSRV